MEGFLEEAEIELHLKDRGNYQSERGVRVRACPQRDREQVFVLLEHDVQIHLRLRTPSSEDQGKRQRETGPWEPDRRSLHLTSKGSRERASFRG